MRRFRHLWPSRSRQPGVSGLVRSCSIAGRRAPASRPAIGARSTATRAWDTWRIFSLPNVISQLPGDIAIGHTRYSTAGDTVLLNAQPFSVACNKGQHRGRAQRQHHQCRRAARATWSGTAPSSRPPATPKSSCTWWRAPSANDSRRRACAMRCCSSKARFRSSFWRRTASSWRAIRTASARWPWADWIQRDGKVAYVFASETCAFDLINADLRRTMSSPARWCASAPRA